MLLIAQAEFRSLNIKLLSGGEVPCSTALLEVHLRVFLAFQH